MPEKLPDTYDPSVHEKELDDAMAPSRTPHIPNWLWEQPPLSKILKERQKQVAEKDPLPPGRTRYNTTPND